MDPKIGCYICKGCDIAKSVDVEKLKEVATETGAAIVKEIDVLCTQEGVEMIKNDIKNEGINRVSIAACSPRMFPEMFEFGDDVFVERTVLREWVAWTHPADDEDTQMLAEDYIRMGCTRARTGEPAVPYKEETSKDILVIGGGIAGMNTAKSAALAGYKVHLVEKEDKLGGWATKFKKVFPKAPPYDDLEDPGHEQLIKDVEANENITVYKSTKVKKTKGQPGQFDVTLQGKESKTEMRVGSIVLATGWKPYDPKNLGKWGYGESENVVTNIQVEEMVNNGGIKRPSDNAAPESIAFIQCAGSRDQDHLPYCSAVCCRTSLKQARYIREQYPDAKVYIIYKDIRSPAQFEKFYANAQKDDGLFMTKGEIESVKKIDGDKLEIEVSETLLGEDIKLHADMVVLATGMVPTAKVEGVDDTKIAEGPPPATLDQEAAETGSGGDDDDEGDEKKAAEVAEPGAHLINLAYRQGTDLPTLKYGFPDSHFICFPYETRRTAIYAAGAVRAPMDFSSTESDAYGASLKAIQAVEAVARGAAVHPRAGDISYPEFFLQRCTQCKRCTEECPFGTLDEDDKGTPLPNTLRCRRCGICMGACPERIISFKNYSVNMMSQMIKCIDVPDEFEEKPRLLAFICENDALPALDIMAAKRMQFNSMVRIIPLRCLGSMNSIWISDALARGFDGAILIGCKKGENYQCHFIKGSELASYRMDNVREKLKQLVLEEERVEIHELALTDFDKIPKIMDDFLETVEGVGFNPYKGM